MPKNDKDLVVPWYFYTQKVGEASENATIKRKLQFITANWL